VHIKSGGAGGYAMLGTPLARYRDEVHLPMSRRRKRRASSHPSIPGNPTSTNAVSGYTPYKAIANTQMP
jgi:hypothetical protein